MASAVNIYSARLEPDAARLEALHAILSPEERERAARFHFPEHQKHFIGCRGILREILGGFLEIPPAELRFTYNAYGKPGVSDSALRFNVSHSGGWAMFAVTQAREVGIDIERINERTAIELIPARFFSAWETAQLCALPVEQQTQAFFRCWTRKEAYIKARGLGLSLPLDSFDVSLAPGEPAALLRGAGNYSVRELPAPEGFAAAVVAEGTDWEVVLNGLVG
jgi:4'-phosphopantetheinyl transferase